MLLFISVVERFNGFFYLPSVFLNILLFTYLFACPIYMF